MLQPTSLPPLLTTIPNSLLRDCNAKENQTHKTIPCRMHQNICEPYIWLASVPAQRTSINRWWRWQPAGGLGRRRGGCCDVISPMGSGAVSARIPIGKPYMHRADADIEQNRLVHSLFLLSPPPASRRVWTYVMLTHRHTRRKHVCLDDFFLFCYPLCVRDSVGLSHSLCLCVCVWVLCVCVCEFMIDTFGVCVCRVIVCVLSSWPPAGLWSSCRGSELSVCGATHYSHWSLSSLYGTHHFIRGIQFNNDKKSR